MEPKATEARHCDFNSIKVRLELTIDTLGNLRAEFQFHKGTIRTHA